MALRSPAPARELARVLTLVGAGVAAFATNQAVGVTLPVHLITDAGGTASDVGLVAAAGTVGVIGGRVLSAALVTRLGPVRLGAASMALVALTCLGYVVAREHVGALALVRAMHGVAFACATTALLVAMVTAVRSLSRQRSMALANLAMPLSLMVFPVLAIEVLDASLRAVAFACAVIGLGGAAAYLSVGRTRAAAVSGDPVDAVDPPVAAAGALRRLPVLLLAPAALLGAADAAALDYLPVLATARGIEGYGWAFTVFALGTAGTLALITALRRGATSASLVVGGGLLTAVALAGWPWASTLGPLMLVVGAYGVGFAVAQTGVNSLAAEWSPAQEGRALAVVLLAFDLGRVVGVYVLGLLIEASGFVAAMVPLAVLLGLVSLARTVLPHSRQGATRP